MKTKTSVKKTKGRLSVVRPALNACLNQSWKRKPKSVNRSQKSGCPPNVSSCVTCAMMINPPTTKATSSANGARRRRMRPMINASSTPAAAVMRRSGISATQPAM